MVEISTVTPDHDVARTPGSDPQSSVECQTIVIENATTNTLAVIDGHGTIPADTQRRNSFVAVNRLPPEILSLILQDPPSNYWHVSWTLRLCTVCKRWRDVLLDTAQAWTEVHAGQLDLARLCLRRSRQAQITFRLVDNYQNVVWLPTKATDILVQNIGRISKLEVHLSVDTFPKALERIAELDAPVLRQLEVRDITYRVPFIFVDPTLPVRRTIAPNPFFATATLQRLVIQGEVVLRDPITAYAQLTSLTLDLHSDHFHAADTFLRTMQACPALEDVFVSALLDKDLLVDDAVIPLRQLRRLTFRLRSAEDATYLLRHMEVHNLMRAEFDFLHRLHHDRQPPLQEFASIVFMLSHLPSALRQSPVHAEFITTLGSLTITAGKHLPPCKPHEAVVMVQFPCFSCDQRLANMFFKKLCDALPQLRITKLVTNT